MATRDEEKRSLDRHREDEKAHKREKLFHYSSCGLQIIGTVLIFVAWASDGENWSYVQMGDYKLGGRGFCDG